MYNKLNPYRSDDTVSLHFRYLSPLSMCLAWRGHVFTHDNNLIYMHACVNPQKLPFHVNSMGILKKKYYWIFLGRALKAHSCTGRKCWPLFINSAKPLTQLGYLSFPGDPIWISLAKSSVVSVISSFNQRVNKQNQTLYGIFVHPDSVFFFFLSDKPAVSAVICVHVITVTTGTCHS